MNKLHGQMFLGEILLQCVVGVKNSFRGTVIFHGAEQLLFPCMGLVASQDANVLSIGKILP